MHVVHEEVDGLLRDAPVLEGDVGVVRRGLCFAKHLDGSCDLGDDCVVLLLRLAGDEIFVVVGVSRWRA